MVEVQGAIHGVHDPVLEMSTAIRDPIRSNSKGGHPAQQNTCSSLGIRS